MVLMIQAKPSLFSTLPNDASPRPVCQVQSKACPDDNSLLCTQYSPSIFQFSYFQIETDTQRTSNLQNGTKKTSKQRENSP